MTVLYVITSYLIISCFLHWTLKCLLLIACFFLLIREQHFKRPWRQAETIQYVNQQWILQSSNSAPDSFAKIEILFDNSLFRLVKFSNSRNRVLMAIFKDQLSVDESRAMYRKANQI